VFRNTSRREDTAFIAKHFRDPDAQVRKELSRALYRVGPDSPQVVVPFLVKGLADEHEDVRITSAGMLNRIGPPHARPAIPALKKALDDPNEKVKKLAKRALENLTK
jgi:HEAT repeat protein